MTRKGEILVWTAVVVATAIAFVSWKKYQTDALYGYELAKLKPIPGATVVFTKFNEGFWGGEDVWIYQLPSGYVQKLIGHCADIGYQEETETVTPGGFVPDLHIRAGSKGCSLSTFQDSASVDAQFVDDKLVVEWVY